MTVVDDVRLAPTLPAALADLTFGPGELCVSLGARTISADSAGELRGALGGALYAGWHAGVVGADKPRLVSHRRDLGLEALLTAAVPHATAVTAAVVHAVEPGGDLLVEIDRVRVRVPAPSVPVPQRQVGARVALHLPAVRPALSPGFLLACGSAGDARGSRVLRLYVHVEQADAAPAVWGALLGVLEGCGAGYRAKVLSRRASFPRRDAVVVYLPEPSWSCVPSLAAAVSGLPGVGAATSLLARRVAPGVAVAWEPRDPRPGRPLVSFGQHRSDAIAEGVVEHLTAGTDLTVAVLSALAAAGIDPLDPARDAGSPPFPDLVAAPVPAGVN